MRAEMSSSPLPPITVDLHPERPLRRGIAPPPKKIPIVALPPDPTFEEIEAAGGKLDLRSDDHDIRGRDGQSTGVRVSGEIKRVTSFEAGLPGAVTWMVDENGEGGWFTDEVSCPNQFHPLGAHGS
jgi:7,8-dihydropterin-6-yl-methyl-4-(beta-D-ribofuranosyl)aminobenzene 5'-phosphate synthase